LCLWCKSRGTYTFSVGEGIGRYQGNPLYHASLSPAEYKGLAGRFGFQVIQHAVNDTTAGRLARFRQRRR